MTGLNVLLVLNNFEALAMLLPPSGTLAVIGSGPGLGVGAVVQTAQGWVALPGEGGHATPAPTNDIESAVLA